MRMIPNILTSARLILVPIIVCCISTQWWGCALALFGCAACTDYADGFIARKWNAHTKFGACLDPVADKTLMGSLFYTGALVHPPLVPFWFALVVIIKETALLLGTLWLLRTQMLRAGTFVSPTPLALGKITMLAQVIGAALLLSSRVYNCGPNMHIFVVPILTALIISSFIAYAYVAQTMWRSSCTAQ